MNKINKFLILLIFAVSFTGCIDDDEFLTAEYYQGVVDVNFLTNAAHAKPAVTGVYDVLSYYGTSWDKMILGSSGADDIVEQHGDANWPSLIAIDQYRWVPEEQGDPKHIWKYWQSYYAGIQRANLVLEKLPALEGMNEALKARYLAEVKALRAYYFYNLVIAFGDVPLILTSQGYEEAINITRSPEADIWEQIIKDLTEAEVVLPDFYDSGEDAGRVTKGMTNALLAQVYLWEKDWTKAESAARKVLSSSAGYQLEPEYADLFNGVSEFSHEAIFSANRAAGSETQSIWSDYIAETNYLILWGLFQSWSWFYQPDPDFVRNNTYIDANDVRIDTVTFDQQNELYDINNDGELQSFPPISSVGINLMKWVPVNVDLTQGVWDGGTGYVDQQLIRLAEVYLDLAEALVEQGDGSGALAYINDIRFRAGVTTSLTTTDKNELLDIILNERKVEFCFEGKRFFDLKRVGRLKEFLGPLGWKDHMVNYPIPQEEIDLTQMTQNSGY